MEDFSDPKVAQSRYTVNLVRDSNFYTCKMAPDEFKSNQIACYTPALVDGTYSIIISIDNQPLEENAYQYKPHPQLAVKSLNTPEITNIESAYGLPQRLIKFTGDFKTSCYVIDHASCQMETSPFISR